MNARHWHISSCLGFVVSGQYRPLCSLIHCAPDCLARRAFQRWADRYFAEQGHTQRMHVIWLITAMLRQSANR